jgi:type IV pilus secretin PilQ/predicted competence protein
VTNETRSHSVTSLVRWCLTAVFPAVVAGALVHAAAHNAPEASGVALPPARLMAIDGHSNGTGASIVIESSEPAAYITTRPEPLTLVVDLRNVRAAGVVNHFTPAAGSPIASVAIEAADVDGAPVSRVRIALSQPVAYRVRSERSKIIVDFDQPLANSAKASYVLPPVSRAGQDATALGPGAGAADPIARLIAPAIPSAAVPPASAREAGAFSLAGSGAQAFGAGGSALLLQAPQAQAPVPPAVPLLPVPPPVPLLPVPQTPVPSQSLGAPQAARRFNGTPVSLDFQGADLRAVLRTFAEISALNMVIDPTVQGTVDVALRDVPWDQALDIILRANKLGYVVDGTIVRIAPLTVLAEEESQRRKLADEQALAGELRVLTVSLSYAKAEEMQGLLTKSALSSRGTVQVDQRTNTLIITDLAARLQVASDLIATLDRAQPQVEIEARIVQTNKNAARALGVQWGFMGRVDPALGNTTNLAFPNNGSLSGGTAATQGVPTNAGGVVPSAVNLPAANATSAVGLALGSINGAFNLDVALSALETSGNGRLLSTPRVSTQNNVAAEIAQGVQIPIQTTANNTVTVSFKDAALILRVTPQITAANTVIMQIVLDNSSPDFGRQVNGIPPINTQRANTTVLVNDGQTTVIGGIYASAESTTNDRTPGLGSVPLLRWLFKRDTSSDTSSELLIFITPRIIR